MSLVLMVMVVMMVMVQKVPVLCRPRLPFMVDDGKGSNRTFALEYSTSSGVLERNPKRAQQGSLQAFTVTAVFRRLRLL